MKDQLLATRCKALKLLLTDVDGVMTDGSILVLSDGSEAKSFHVRDGLGIVLAHSAGLSTGILSGRASEAVAHRAAELKMSVVRQGVKDKGAALKEICAEQGLEPREIAFIGDDVNDLPLFGEVGLCAAPKDAVFEVRAQAFMVTDAEGGRGCLREFIEAILRARGDWEPALTRYGIPVS